MFDTYVIGHGRAAPSGPSRVDVHEHRAPTDQSVALLAEMEQKMRDRIVKTIPLQSNHFSGEVLVMNDVAIPGHRYIAVFELNGERHQVEFAGDWRTIAEQDAVIGLREKVAIYLANLFMVRAVEATPERFL